MNEAKFASVDSVIEGVQPLWRPPPKLTLSVWADADFYLSAESSAQAGRWATLPYQREPMDAMTDPAIERVSMMKSARVGYTKMVDALIGFHIDHDPCSMLVVQPTEADAEGFSKEEIAPMLRDCPKLAGIIYRDAVDAGPKDTGNTILHKHFPGGILSMTTASSGAGFRRISRRVVIFDEVDGYPSSAGNDGDPIKLGIKRTEFFHNRKIIAGSTPLLAGHSRIEQLFHQGDQRRYYVPCPQCGHMDHLVFTERVSGGHFMKFDPAAPEGAHFVCSLNGCVIEHHHKRDMVARGEWRKAKPCPADCGEDHPHVRPEKGHASFHIWAAYSYSPNATWAQIASEFISCKKDREQLKTFINTVLGETWQEAGDAPDWERLYERREQYPIGSVPPGVLFLTAGVDVQKDRWVYEVVGWGLGKESWSIDAGVIPGVTETDEDWAKVDELLGRSYSCADGRTMPIGMMAVDSGFNTQLVYTYARRHVGRVIATKGTATARVLVGSPSPVDIKRNGRQILRGTKVWPVGVDMAKAELYGWLRLRRGVDLTAPFPPGWCHFPEHGPDYFKQLTGEHLVSSQTRKGYTATEWQLIPGRENHWLDCRVYARAAASLLNLDRMAPRPPRDPLASAAALVAAGDAARARQGPPKAPAQWNPTKQPPKPPPARAPFLGQRRQKWLK